ncbi:MAG: M48 family metallopeptidase [Rubrivivax sp.]|jgi:Zn-dependent protease with chaperone function
MSGSDTGAVAAAPPAARAAGGSELLRARWFNGREARALEVDLALNADVLCLTAAGGATHHYARRAVTWPERTRHGVPQLLLPDGSVVELPDAPAWDDWAARHHLAEPMAVRWARSWHVALGCVVGVVLLMAGAGVWGVPWAAEKGAVWVPQAARAHIDRLVLSQLQSRGWLEPSKLPAGTVERLRTALDDMVGAAYPADKRPRVQLAVHALPQWAGPNAFALPGGQIVVSDALLEMLPGEGDRFHPGVLGVLAHEVGHVHANHGLRNLIVASGIGALAGMWIGDFSSVLATAPTLLIQASYSRDFEREADREALRIMRAAGVDPRGMVAFFTQLQRRYPARQAGLPDFGLASHPPDSERTRLFESGAR